MVIVQDDNPFAEPRNCPNAGTKSPDESPCRYNSGNTSPIFGVLRAHGGRIAEENRCRSPVAGSVRLSLTRGAVTSIAPAWSAPPGSGESRRAPPAGDRSHPYLARKYEGLVPVLREMISRPDTPLDEPARQRILEQLDRAEERFNAILPPGKA